MEYREPEYNPVTGEELEEGCYMMAHNTPDGLSDYWLSGLRSGAETKGE